MNEIVAAELTTFDVAPDGGQVRLRVRDVNGAPAALTLPSRSIAELMMTLPKMLQISIQKQHQDSTLRLVHELGEYTLEKLAGEAKVILTLRTPDGFEVSFALTSRDVTQIADACCESELSQPSRLM